MFIRKDHVYCIVCVIFMIVDIIISQQMCQNVRIVNQKIGIVASLRYMSHCGNFLPFLVPQTSDNLVTSVHG